MGFDSSKHVLVAFDSGKHVPVAFALRICVPAFGQIKRRASYFEVSCTSQGFPIHRTLYGICHSQQPVREKSARGLKWRLAELSVVG